MADKVYNIRAAGAGKAASVEDYNDESETAVPETKKTANITAKRSKPEVTKLQVVRDEFSDSGHSNQTLATLGSTNTSLDSKSGSLTIRAESYAGAGTTKPISIEQKPRSKSRSPEKLPSQGAAAEGRKEYNYPARKQPCSCDKCIAKARRATFHFHHPSKSTGKARPPVPEKPQDRKLRPVHVAKEAPVPQYAPPRPRFSNSRSYHLERPTSLYAGAAPERLYISTQQPIYNEPQPSLNYPPTSTVVPSPYPAHAAPYIASPQTLHQHQAQQFYPSPPSPYEFQSGPPPRQWISDHQTPSRPQSVLYATSPIIEYVAEPNYALFTASTQPPSRQSSHRERSRALPEQRSTRDEDYYNMPPPPPPPPPPLPPRHRDTSYQNRRPAIRHTVTADAHPTYTQRRTVRGESTMAHVGHESHDKQNHSSHERVRRPSGNASEELAPTTYGIERRMARTNLGSDATKHRRRASVYGHETLNELENELAHEVEAYQASKGNGRTSNQIPPMPPPSLMRKKTHTSSKSSETSSRKSAKSGKSRTSKTSKEGSDLRSRRPSEDKLSMRFDVSQGVNVDLKGGMEGRNISIRQNKEEGELEVSIGSRGRVATGAGRESREKSRKRSAYRNGQSETQIERTRTISRPEMKIRGTEGEEDETERRIIRERITTRTRSQRGSSRAGGERVGFN